MDMLIDVKGWRAVGNRLSNHTVKAIELVASPDKKGNGSDDSLSVGSTVKFDLKKKREGDDDEDEDKEQLGLF
jgi:topoisomerase-4 subunit A